MRLFITFSKKTLLIVLAALAAGIIILGEVFTIRAGGADGSTNAQRCGFARDLGVTPDETAVSVKEIVIPEEFSDVYMKYNGLQRSAGYDLMPYRGRKATVYTYGVTDAEDTVINLIVSDGKIIGGDISSVRIDGEMKPLIPV